MFDVKRDGMIRQNRVGIRLEDDIYTFIRGLADLARLPMSQIIRGILIEKMIETGSVSQPQKAVAGKRRSRP